MDLKDTVSARGEMGGESIVEVSKRGPQRRGGEGRAREEALRVLAEHRHPEDASSQETGRHDQVELEEGDLSR